MRCIRCETDNALQDYIENQGRCENCQHPFAFDPASMGKVKFTDSFFLKSITDLSDNNTLFFTTKQLFYMLDRKIKNKEPLDTAILFLLLAFFSSGLFFLESPIWSAIAVINCWASGFIASGGGFDDPSNDIPPKERKILLIISMFCGLLTIAEAILILVLYSHVLAFVGFSIFVILGMYLVCLNFYLLSTLKYIPQDFKIALTQFQGWINAWVKVNGSIEKMLPFSSTENQPTHLSSKITAYSFDRAIVCDSAEIAQFLIANNFHLENNCAVLSIDGYPQNIFSTIMEMLHRNPNLKVYALHDASPQGISLANQLRTNNHWFANSSATIYDLGLSPRQVFKSRSLFIRNSPDSKQEAARLPQIVKQELSPDELEWLEKGNFVELESLMPRQLLQVLTRGITLSQAIDVEDALIVVESDDSSIFATDSFD